MRRHTRTPKNFTYVKPKRGYAFTVQVILQVPPDLQAQYGCAKLTKLLHGQTEQEVEALAAVYIQSQKDMFNWLSGPTQARIYLDVSGVVMTTEVIAKLEETLRSVVQSDGIQVDDIVTSHRTAGLTRRQQLENRKAK
jgi:hypothetical protein